ncbi:SRPBCC domain-containing protein [Lacibacter luteus]|uniref:SRPBCC domain-containing protein n=1 Tax=Lacibacter luteus TaxID=2508719 RepID=A0A4Q1CMS3_9BACT|nr:SRPBCC domain-containing protein [Lacibacter luteus]RXK62340.1 SRPBCC domain-containing protein [Lacibacter luteus]
MERLHFSVKINAPKEKVWDVLWTKGNYEAWTAVFAPGSTAISDWQQGSRILFTDGTGNGMVSEIAEKRENEYMSFTHLGEIKDGIEDTTSDKVKVWNGSKENYTLTQNNNGTTLDVEIDISAEYKDYFLGTWPKAMEVIKTMAEQTN